MPKVARELSPLAINKLTTPGTHAVGGVAGLSLRVYDAGQRAWVLRTMVAGKRREFGLGGYPTVLPASARDRARATLDKIFAGLDPTEEKQRQRSALRAAKAKAVSFGKVAEQYIAQHEAGWKNPKHAAQWATTLATYAYPVIGSVTVANVDTPLVLKVLEPIWTDKTETASRLRGRIEAILDYATAKGLREGPNPARWKGHLALTLPAKRKVAPVEHHKSIPVTEMPSFMKQLRQISGVSARALEFLTLTAARSGEVRGMEWNEVDLVNKIWVVPAIRMKAKREHRVPLSDAAVLILNRMKHEYSGSLVFPGAKGKALSDMSLTSVMRRMGTDAVPHGLRSSFRNWTAEMTTYPNEVAEMALAHTVNNAVEAAYRRGDLFEKRRNMMGDWAQFLELPSRTLISNLLMLGSKR
jgi:integrase